MYTDDIKLFAKTKNKNGNSYIRSQNIQSRYKDGIWHRKMYHANNDKQEKTHDGRNGTTKSKKKKKKKKKKKMKKRTLEEKEAFKYVRILEVNTIKQVEMKEKIRKEYLRRTVKLLEPN